MRFEVPQFIDVEDKLFGPLTFKQFIYIVGGIGMAYVSYKLLPTPFFFITIPVFIGLGLLFAFYKLNNQTFMELAQSFLSYQIKGKLYIWRRITEKEPAAKNPPIPQPPQNIPKPFNDKIVTDLAQNLDILDQ